MYSLLPCPFENICESVYAISIFEQGRHGPPTRAAVNHFDILPDYMVSSHYCN